MTDTPADPPSGQRRFRSQDWFADHRRPDQTALYLERYANHAYTLGELRSGKPIIGIAQTGSDLSPCNRHHLELAQRVRDGIIEAGGIPFEFPVHPIQETGPAPDGGARPEPRLPRARRDPARLPDRRRRADHRLRQDDAGVPHGRGDGRSSGDRAVGRPDARRLPRRRPARRLRHAHLAHAPQPRPRRDRRGAVHRRRGELRPIVRALQHDGHRLDDERDRRGARHVADGLRRDPRAVQGASRRWHWRPADASWRWRTRT